MLSTAPPTVIHVGVYAPGSPNGIHRMIYDTIHHYQQQVQFQVVSFDLSVGDEYWLETPDGIRVHHFSLPRLKGFALPEGFTHWLNSLPQRSIFHLHGVFNPEAYAVGRWLVPRGIPYLYTPHDAYSSTSLRSNALAKRVYIALAERFLLDHAAGIQATTLEGAANIARYTNRPVTLAPLFTPDPQPDMTTLQQRRAVGFVGRLDIYQKGLDLALTAFHQFRQMTGCTAPLLLIGPEEAGSAAELRAQCTALGLTPEQDVYFLGVLDEPAKKRLLATCRAYLQLSRFEGFGISIIEALAQGLPAVISPQVPISGLIHNNGGFVVETPSQAADALAAIFALADDAYTDLVHKARTTYIQHFSPQASNDTLLKLYQTASAG